MKGLQQNKRRNQGQNERLAVWNAFRAAVEEIDLHYWDAS